MAECDDSEIDKILDSAKRNNPGLDITGVLLYTEKKFIQYLEGAGIRYWSSIKK